MCMKIVKPRGLAVACALSRTTASAVHCVQRTTLSRVSLRTRSLITQRTTSSCIRYMGECDQSRRIYSITNLPPSTKREEVQSTAGV